MFARSAVLIDKEKSKKFRKLVSENAKNKEFWEEIKKTVSVEEKEKEEWDISKAKK